MVLKLDNKFDEMEIQKGADMVVERYTQEKEKELKKKKMEKGK